MTRATVRRWTLTDHPNPWDYLVPRASGTVHGCMPTWRRAYDRTLQLISDQT